MTFLLAAGPFPAHATGPCDILAPLGEQSSTEAGGSPVATGTADWQRSDIGLDRKRAKMCGTARTGGSRTVY